MKNKFVDIDNVREDEQREVMQQIIDNQECPFCPEILNKYHQQEIIFENDHWLLTPNQWPYQHIKHHLLLILKTHKENLSELTLEEGAALIEVLKKAQEFTQAPGGGFAMRFGDTNYSAATINHLHAQFIVPDIHAPDFQPTRIKLGKEKERRATKD